MRRTWCSALAWLAAAGVLGFAAADEAPAVLFEFAPLRSPVALGHDVVFDGRFEVRGAALRRRLRVQPLELGWRIVKRGSAIAILQGAAHLRGAQTPLRIRTRPAEPGVYELLFDPLPPAAGVALRIAQPERNRIEVTAAAPDGRGNAAAF